jgi:hypothetical protein
MVDSCEASVVLALIDRLVPDKRRLKKRERQAVKWLREVASRRGELPEIDGGKGFRIPTLRPAGSDGRGYYVPRPVKDYPCNGDEQ